MLDTKMQDGVPRGGFRVALLMAKTGKYWASCQIMQVQVRVQVQVRFLWLSNRASPPFAVPCCRETLERPGGVR